MTMLSRQLGVVLLLGILITGYAPHYTTFDSRKFNWYNEGEFPMWGRLAGWSSPPFDSGLPSEVVLEVKNDGDSDATGVEVQLRYSDFGVGATTWFDVDSQLVNVPAGETVKVSFFPTFRNRAQVSLEATFTVPPSKDAGPDAKENLEGRATGGFGGITCGGECTLKVPMRNDGEHALAVDLLVLCLPEGSQIPESCPAENMVQIVNQPDVIPGQSEVLLEVNVSLADSEALTVVVQDTSNPGTLNEAAVRVVQASAVEVLNTPMLCCLSSVRVRAGLGAYLASALAALEKEDDGKAIALLRFFLQRAAALASATPSEGERSCLEQGMHLVSSAAGLIAKEQAPTDAARAALLGEGDLLRRAGEHAAAALLYERASPFASRELQGRLVHWPDSGLVGDAGGRSWLAPHTWTHAAVTHRAGDLGGGGVGEGEAQSEAQRRRRRRRRARYHMHRAAHHMHKSTHRPHSYAVEGEVEMVEAARSMLAAAGELLELQERDSPSGWLLEVTEVTAMAAENPVFAAQAGASTNVIAGKEASEEVTSAGEAEGLLLESVLRMSAHLRHIRRARLRARAARHLARAKARRQAAGEEAEEEVGGVRVEEGGPCRALPEGVWPPVREEVATEALEELLGCVREELEAGGEEPAVAAEREALLGLLQEPQDVMGAGAVRVLEEEAKKTLEWEAKQCETAKKAVGLCCRSGRRAGEGEGRMGALLALHERVLDLLDDGAYWVELARDAGQEGGGFLTASPTTMAPLAQATNPRVVGGSYWNGEEVKAGAEEEVGVWVEQTTKVKTWRRGGGGGCGEGAECECEHLGDAEGVCVSAEEDTAGECKCEWLEADWRREVPDWSTVLAGVEVRSQRKGQPLRVLAQEIRVEVQTMKSEGRRTLTALDQDAIHQATYEAILKVDTTTSVTAKKGDEVSLVGFGSFMRKGRAKKRQVMPDPRRSGRRAELDHIGAYNFMIDGISAINYGTTQALSGTECEDTYEEIQVLEYDEEGAAKLRERLQQPLPSAGGGLADVPNACVLGDPYDPRVLWELNNTE